MGSVAALEIVRRLGTNGSFLDASASMPIANSIMLFNFRPVGVNGQAVDTRHVGQTFAADCYMGSLPSAYHDNVHVAGEDMITTALDLLGWVPDPRTIGRPFSANHPG